MTISSRRRSLLEATVRDIPNLWVLDVTAKTRATRERAVDRLTQLSRGEALPAADVLRVFQALQTEIDRKHVWVHPGVSDAVEIALIGLVKKSDLSVSEVGTCWRFLVLVGSKSSETRRYKQQLALGWFPTRNMPLEFLATPVAETAAEAPLIVPSAAHDVVVRLAEKYPDLAGLPDVMLCQLASTFPVSDDWFVDVFPLSAGVEWVAPKVPAPAEEVV